MASRRTRSATPQLAVIMHGQLAGHVFVAANRRLTFRYEDSWRSHPSALPLSLSMPLARVEHGHRAISAWLWGVLPDNPEVVAQWARAFGVSRHDAVSLLAHVGEDCAGAVQLVAPNQTERVVGASTTDDERLHVEWLRRQDVGVLLEGLRRNPAAGRTREGQGQFSLAGAQPKTALYQTARGRWGIPRGRVPSNRILKPPVLDLADLAYNEHACLALARELGLAASASSVQQFAGELAIVVERYDRVRVDGVLRRVHQEDLCQVLAVQPTRKYETDGGPGVVDVATALARHSSAPALDVARFLDAVMFNWLIGGTDAHAKNFAVLLGAGGDVRLAPLYDVITALPYTRLTGQGVPLAMAIHGERAAERIGRSHFAALANAVDVPADQLLDRLQELARRLPGAVDAVVSQHEHEATVRAIVQQLLRPVIAHARACQRRL